MMYDSERHVKITEANWSRELVVEEIRKIYTDILARKEPNGLWLAHPDEDGEGLPFNKTLYAGATGTLWGLLEISHWLGVSLPFDPTSLAESIYEKYLLEPDTGAVVPSYFLGDSTILLLLKKLKPSAAVTEALRKSISLNTKNPVNEALWGAPGTMLAALKAGHIDLYREGANHLFAEWTEESEGVWVWNQDLYGKKFKFIGAGHGFFGNVYSLLEGQEHLSEEQRKLLLERTVSTSFASARRADGMANWMPGFLMKEDPRPPVTQWCHGAPGTITSLRSFPKNYSSDFNQLLIEAAETVWQAGPLKKGIGICHGTDGNGFALLRMFERTGDEIWLERARRFAMHSLSQKNGRSTLWTGEIGMALFLMSCIDGKGDFPSLDYF